MRIEEDVGGLIRVGGGEKNDDKVGREGSLFLFDLCMLVFVFVRRFLRLDFIIFQ